MSLGSLLVLVIVGAIAGFLAGRLTQGRGFGVGGNILIGIVGAVVGGVLLNIVGFAAYTLLARIISATVGAVALLWVARRVR